MKFDFVEENQPLSDVEFKIEEKSLCAHKIVLTMKSDVFKNMFCGSIPFKDEPVLIKDIEYKVFKAMLKFFHMGNSMTN
ncbi:unnamed protein product [Gordionus sp. m RMFG-2023]